MALTMALYLLDTNVLIDLAGARESGPFFGGAIGRGDNRFGTSILCVAEFLAGARVREEKFLLEWIGSEELEIFFLDSVEGAKKAASIRKTHKLALPDALILATAARSGAVLLTHDRTFLDTANIFVKGIDPFGPQG